MSQPMAQPMPGQPGMFPGAQATSTRDDLLPDHPLASRAQLLGLIGTVMGLLGFALPAPFGLRAALTARRESAAHPGVYRHGGPLQAGFVLSIIGTVLLGLNVLVILAVIALVASSGMRG